MRSSASTGRAAGKLAASRSRSASAARLRARGSPCRWCATCSCRRAGSRDPGGSGDRADGAPGGDACGRRAPDASRPATSGPASEENCAATAVRRSMREKERSSSDDARDRPAREDRVAEFAEAVDARGDERDVQPQLVRELHQRVFARERPHDLLERDHVGVQLGDHERARAASGPRRAAAGARPAVDVVGRRPPVPCPSATAPTDRAARAPARGRVSPRRAPPGAPHGGSSPRIAAHAHVRSPIHPGPLRLHGASDQGGIRGRPSSL